MNQRTHFAATSLLLLVSLLVTFVVAEEDAFLDEPDPATTLALEQDRIRCKVCERAIQHIWDRGEKLRRECMDDHGSDHRCDLTSLGRHAIEEMSHAVCEDLPKTHKAIVGEGWDLVLADKADVNHTEQDAHIIEDACFDWLHHEHGVQRMTKFIWANLVAHKTQGTILHILQHRFCKAACDSNREKRVITEDEL